MILLELAPRRTRRESDAVSFQYIEEGIQVSLTYSR
jgi:hypothetical protein